MGHILVASVYSAFRDSRPGLWLAFQTRQISRAPSSVLAVAILVRRPAPGSRPLGHAGLLRDQVRVKMM